jgi:tetratricopeptide (TPR) repeat protein
MPSAARMGDDAGGEPAGRPPMSKSILILSVTTLLSAGAAWASGGGPAPMGGSMGGGSSSTPHMSPAQMAASHYNDGLKQQQKADEYNKEAEGTEDAKKRAKIEANAGKYYEKARDNYQSALRLDSTLFQAYGALGYVLRRLGDYDGSLASYAHALEIQPGYSPAIEYRGEAFLGLNRVEDAKAAYMSLFNSDRARATELSNAMTKWLTARRADPAGVDAKTIEDFSTWLSQRLELAKQTAALLPPKENRW